MSIHKTKVGTYQVRWRERGRLKAKNFDRKIDAEKFEASLKLGIQSTEPAKLVEETMRVTDFVDIWMKDHGHVHKSASSLIRDRQIIRDYVLPQLGKYRLNEVLRRDLVQMQGNLNANSRLKPKTINNVMGLVCKLFKDAAQWQYVMSNPAAGLKPIKVPEQAYRFWTFAERDRFLSWAKVNDPELYKIVAIAVLTGMRRGEMEGLLRDCLDFEQKQIVIRRSYCHKTHQLNSHTKGKKVRRVPMNGLVASLLRESSLIPLLCQVLPFDYQHVVPRRFVPAQVKAGVSIITFHDLRHTFASHLAMSGVGVFDIKELLGHSDIGTTMRYMHLAPGHLAGRTDVLLRGLESSSVDTQDSSATSRESLKCSLKVHS